MSMSARLSSSALATEVAENSTVSYQPAVLEALRRAAQGAFDTNAKPILGLLLGRVTPAGLAVSAWMPATSLDAGRDANLRRALELARLEYPSEHPIGWFRSKHQGEARLTTEELEAVSHFIPVGTPLALVLRPSSQRPLRVASYFAFSGAPPAGERPAQEFFIHPEESESRSAAPRADFDLHVVGAANSAPLPASMRGSIGTRSRLSQRFQASLEGLRWAMPAGMLIITAIAGVAISQLPPEDRVLPFAVTAKSTAPEPVKLLPDPLRVSASGNQWVVRWAARPTAAGATLTVTHGARKDTVALTPSQYAAGTFSVAMPAGVPKDADVEVLLRTQETGDKFWDVRTRIVGSATTLPPVVAATSRLSVELDKVKLELQAERNRRQLLQDMVQAQNASSH